MTTAAVRREETKHTGRELFQCLYKRLLLSGLLIEPYNREEKQKNKSYRVSFFITYKVSTA